MAKTFPGRRNDRRPGPATGRYRVLPLRGQDDKTINERLRDWALVLLWFLVPVVTVTTLLWS